MHESCGRWLSGTRNVFTVSFVRSDRHRPIAHARRTVKPHGRKAVALNRSAFAVVSTTRSVCFPHTDTDPVNTYESCETQTAVIS
jgi:hypothetical protein